MKITGNNSMNVARIYNDNKLKPSGQREKAGKGYDTVEISREGMEIARYVSMVSDISDVRADRVEEIKARIKNGTYNMSSDKLASSIMEHIQDSLDISGIDGSLKED